MYDGLNDETRDQVEIMYNFEFLDQPIERAWDFFEWFPKDTYKQEMAHTLPSLDMNHTIFLDRFGVTKLFLQSFMLAKVIYNYS